MSNALAIATVTTALAQLVRTAAQSSVPGADVTTERPDTTPVAQARVRLYLYQVSPNAALRNHDLPARQADGTLVKRPVAAVDLHYLLAFYGNDNELEAQRMLGAVVRDLHAKPVLRREMIANAVSSQPFLTASNLADAFEQVKLTPLPMTLEELAKIWSVFFQTPYALSVAYQATAVLIESEETAQAGLPVLRRGQEDRGVDTLLGPFPALTSWHVGELADDFARLRQPSYLSARLGATLTLRGENLAGETRKVRFTHQRLGTVLDLNAPLTEGDPNRIILALPNAEAPASAAWAAGIYTLAVIVTNDVINGGRDRASNALPLSFAPRLDSVTAGERDADNNVTLTVVSQPTVRRKQQAVVVLPDSEAVAKPRANDADPLLFVLKNPAAGETALRLRVDGVDSLEFKLDGNSLPLVMERQKVTIP